MNAAEVVQAALIAGAVGGVSGGATEVAKAVWMDAYAGLKGAVRKVLTRHGKPEDLDTDEIEPGVWATRIGHALGGDVDEETVEAAQKLLAILDPDGTKAGRYEVAAAKYKVNLQGAHAVQVGDGNTMTLNFGAQQTQEQRPAN